MSHSTHFQRVSKAFPCAICGRPDWCLFAGPNDSPTAAICARVESPKRFGQAGWLHPLRDDHNWRPTRRRIIRPKVTGTADMRGLAHTCAAAIGVFQLDELAAKLGITPDSLRRLRVGWSSDHQAYSFPMSVIGLGDVGIRLRLPDGQKFSVRGGHEGLFVPSDVPSCDQLLITEGPSDCGALLDLGFDVIGRPNCTGATDHVIAFVCMAETSEVVIVADDDAPGQRGAEALARKLVAYVPDVRLIKPPDGIKDARAWVCRGATMDTVNAAIDSAVPISLAIKTRRREVHRNG